MRDAYDTLFPREVLDKLAEGRQDGLDFDTAWRRATALADPGWNDALEQTRDAWRRAFLGEEDRLERLCSTMRW